MGAASGFNTQPPECSPNVPCMKWAVFGAETEVLPPCRAGTALGSPWAPRTWRHHWAPASPTGTALAFNHLHRVRA